MKKTEIIDNGFRTEIAAELKHYNYDVIIVDMASLDDDRWQIRESYISQAGADDYIQVTHGDGYNGWNIAEQCVFPKAGRTAAIAAHLGLTVDELVAMVDEINDVEHLNSVSWSMLEELQAERALAEAGEEGDEA